MEWHREIILELCRGSPPSVHQSTGSKPMWEITYAREMPAWKDYRKGPHEYTGLGIGPGTNGKLDIQAWQQWCQIMCRPNAVLIFNQHFCMGCTPKRGLHDLGTNGCHHLLSHSVTHRENVCSLLSVLAALPVQPMAPQGRVPRPVGTARLSLTFKL